MIGWIILWVFLGLIALIGILLLFSVIFHIEYHGDYTVKIKYLCITLYDSTKPPKSKKNKKSKKKSKNKKSKQIKLKQKKRERSKKENAGAASNTEHKESLFERVKGETGLDKIADDIKKNNSKSFDFGVFKLAYDSYKAPVKQLVQKLRVRNLILDHVIGGEDAATTALSYGLQSAAISGLLAWIDELLSLKVKRVNVTCDFSAEKSDLYIKCKIKLRVISAAVIAVKYIWKTAKKS